MSLRFRLVLLLALCGGAVSMPAAVAAGAQPAPAEGRRLFMQVGCYQCHGTVGQGGAAGPRLAPDAWPLEALLPFLRNGTRLMPAYPASILPDAEIAAIQVYLASIPAPPRPGAVPALRGVRGVPAAAARP
jgi:ubiquinol-cytochrome c reductase cytochrome c subunit